MEKPDYHSTDAGHGIIINETECSKIKDIDEQLQHYRICDKCFIELKLKMIEFLNTSSGKLLKTIITGFLRKDQNHEKK